MSDYYDLDKPYSIENWNTLIQDVNEILQNPPEGSVDCPPIEPIEEVEDPHIWAIKDVEEVRDKLEETCPHISFEEELEIWKPGIIDEIEKQMEDAWCDCVVDPDEDILSFGPYSWQAVNAGAIPEHCCGIEEQLSPCYICVGQHCQETQWMGDFYESPGPNNVPLFDQICDTWTIAKQATYDYISAINALKEFADDIEENQDKVDIKTALLDQAIQQYENQCRGSSPPPNCAQILQNICDYGEDAREYQDKVDEYILEFKEKYQIQEQKRQQADNAAAQNWAAAASLVGRFPPDTNILAENYIGTLTNENWADWYDPNYDDDIADLYAFMMGYRREEWEIRPFIRTYRTNTRYPDRRFDSYEIKISPSGIPFIKGWAAKMLVRSYSETYVLTRSRWRCESYVGWGCEPEPGNCEFPDWPDFETIWWHQGWPAEDSCVGNCKGFCSWIFSPLPEPDLGSFGVETFSLEFERLPNRKGTDKTQQQEEYYSPFLDWYEEHPQYDDRHESYCG